MATPGDPNTVLAGAIAVRRRPAMYLGCEPDDPAAIEVLLWWVVACALEDRPHDGRVTRIAIAIDGARVTVEDDGRPLPRRPLHGGPLDLVTALASELEIERWLDGTTRILRHVRGEPLGDEVDGGPTTRTGTRVVFAPDFTILKPHAWDRVAIARRGRELAALVPELAVSVDGDEVCSPGGLADHVRYLAGGREIVEPFRARGTHEGIAVDLAIAWVDRATSAIHAFVNRALTRDGLHVDGLFVGLSAVIGPRLANDRHAPIRGQLEPGAIAVVHVCLADPTFADPRRTTLTDVRALAAVRTVAAAAFATHVVEVPAQLDALLQRLAAVATREVTIVRCPRCGATDAGVDPDKGVIEIRYMECHACGESAYVDDYQIKDDWNVEIDLPLDAPALPAFVAPLR